MREAAQPEPESNEALIQLGRAVDRLDEVLLEAERDVVRDATIQRFEFTFELAWKAMKRALAQVEGIEAASPKQTLQKAYAVLCIADERAWLDMLADRNLSSRTYQEELAKQMYGRIRGYAPELRRLANLLAGMYQPRSG